MAPPPQRTPPANVSLPPQGEGEGGKEAQFGQFLLALIAAEASPAMASTVGCPESLPVPPAGQSDPHRGWQVSGDGAEEQRVIGRITEGGARRANTSLVPVPTAAETEDIPFNAEALRRSACRDPDCHAMPGVCTAFKAIQLPCAVSAFD